MVQSNFDQKFESTFSFEEKHNMKKYQLTFYPHKLIDSKSAKNKQWKHF